MKVLLIALALSTTLLGCTHIPKNASVLNQKVSEGIGRNQLEVEKVIVALADVERGILDQQWDSIYLKIEQKFIEKHSLSVSALTHEHRRKIAANAAKTYYNLLEEISSMEKALILQTKANSETLVKTNDQVTQYLLSLESLDDARNNIKQKIGKITGFDISKISGLSKKLIGGL